MIICSILAGTKFFFKNSLKNESNLLVIISWLWSRALILCHGAIPFNTILPLFFCYIYISSLKVKSLEPICMLLLMLKGLKRRGANRSGPISFLSIGPHPQQVMTVTYRSIRAFFLGTFHILAIVCGEKKVTFCT
ncbi:hypothetical protein NC652_018804 [Populus alba x Populus x berolinensis]|nr:hypothetical protein NC652_018804 [Populus alba x Populus x berolinensis]